MAPKMDLKDLRCVVAIAEAGSFLQAADALNMTQPSISSRIRDLEARLGVVLFERLARGVRLTREGADLLVHARRIIRQFEEAEIEMQAHRQAPVGLVRLGLPTSLTALLAVPILERCLVEFPDVKLRIVESMSGYILNWLQEEKLDLGVVFGAPTPAISAKPLVEESLLLAGADDDAFVQLDEGEGTVRFRALSRLPLIMPGPDHGLRSLVERQARREGVDLQVVVEIDAFSEIQRLVEKGLGYTILSAAAVRTADQPKLATRLVVRPSIDRVVALAHSAFHPLTRASREVGLLIEDVIVRKAQEESWHARRLLTEPRG